MLLLLIVLSLSAEASVCTRAQELTIGFTNVEKTKSGYTVVSTDLDQGIKTESVLTYTFNKKKNGFDTKEVITLSRFRYDEKTEKYVVIPFAHETHWGFSEKPPVWSEEMADRRQQDRMRREKALKKKQYLEAIVKAACKQLGISEEEFQSAKEKILERNATISKENLQIAAVGYGAVFSPNAVKFLNDGKRLLRLSREAVIRQLEEEEPYPGTVGSGVHERYAHVIDGLKLLRENGFRVEAEARMQELIAGLE